MAHMNDIAIQRFFVRNCSLARIAVGESASSLLELRDKLMTIDENSIYYHFWGGRMHPQFIHTQNHNDFSSWVYHRLNDHILAEKLSIIDPMEFNNLESLRQEILETIETRLDNYEIIFYTKKEDQFHFVRSSIIVFDSILSILNPEDLPQIIPQLSPGNIFYHFIDARVRTSDKTDDFSVWLKMFGSEYDDLIEIIQAIDPYFLSLTQLRDELTYAFQNYFNRENHG
jgi:Family of unknown function (DUF5752)